MKFLKKIGKAVGKATRFTGKTVGKGAKAVGQATRYTGRQIDKAAHNPLVQTGLAVGAVAIGGPVAAGAVKAGFAFMNGAEGSGAEVAGPAQYPPDVLGASPEAFAPVTPQPREPGIFEKIMRFFFGTRG